MIVRFVVIAIARPLGDDIPKLEEDLPLPNSPTSQTDEQRLRSFPELVKEFFEFPNGTRNIDRITAVRLKVEQDQLVAICD